MELQSPVRILVADDHTVLRTALCSLLRRQTGVEVVGEAGDGQQTLKVASEIEADILLLDVGLPDIDGIEITRQLKQSRPGLRILILSAYEESPILRDAIGAGASGYLIKRATEAELMDAIHAVMRGELYIHPGMTRSLLDFAAPTPAAPLPHESDELTPREIEVLDRVCRGYTNSQIAEELCLSARTVETHRANIMKKLGLHSRAELVRYAAERGLIPRN